jgi:hypothetical protein
MRPIPHVRWCIGGLLFLSTVINYIDRQTPSVLAPYMKTEYQCLFGASILPIVAMAAMLLLVRNTRETRQEMLNTV